MAPAFISSLIRASIAPSIASTFIGLGVGSGKKGVGEKEREADVDAVANDNDDSYGGIGGKVAPMSVEYEDVDEEPDKTENTSESIMDVGDEKRGIFVNSVSSGSPVFVKSAVK